MKGALKFLLLFVGLGLQAQDLNREKLDSLFSLVDENKKAMLSVSLFKNGNQIYSNAIGYANLEKELPAKEKTKYRIGSISKTFTAVIIMQLVEEGKLNLADKLQKFFPEMPNAELIEIADLLRHQSGLYNFTNDEKYPEWMEEPKTRKELLEIFRQKASVFIPNERTEYSNTNYVLLTFIAEEVTGKNYKQLLKERIAEPLGLEDTYYGGPISAEANEALSYTKNDGWKLSTETDMSVPQGAGAVVSTPYDLNVFYTSLFEGKLVKENSLEQMTEIRSGMGLGIMRFPFKGKNFYGHSGGIDGFSSIAAYSPEEQLGMAFTANAIDMSLNELVIGILSIRFNEDYELPVFAPVLKLPAEELQPYTGAYSGDDFPLKIVVFIRDSRLMVQATGQSAVPLDAIGANKFKFDPVGLLIEFFPEEDKLILSQSGMRFELKKE